MAVEDPNARQDPNLRALNGPDLLAEIAVLRGAVDDAARHVRGMFLTFLLFAFYVAVIVFSTDDEQLLKQTGVHLPLLDVDLPLLGFYAVVPWLVLLFHAHLLNQHFLLSRKLFNLEDALCALPQGMQRVQRELPFPLIFAHQLLGRHYPRPIRWVFGITVNATLVLMPLLLLASMQWKFLPYHSGRITFVHQLVFTLDGLLLWLFWPRIGNRQGRWQVQWRKPIVASLLAQGVALIVVWFLLVPPGAGVEVLTGHQDWLDRVHRNLELTNRVLMRQEPPTELLNGPQVKTKNGRQKIWAEAGRALQLRGRDLRRANLSGSELWSVDLIKAQLQYANLKGTVLQGAILLNADLRRANLQSARLQGARLARAGLRSANLTGANLQGADLRGADLQGATLSKAKLQGADLRSGELQGANLSSAKLQGADLSVAESKDGSSAPTKLQGADLNSAELQGAKLRSAQLQGADLSSAKLHGADLSPDEINDRVFPPTNLEGAKLRKAQLQGADLRWTKLQAADFRRATFFGTRFGNAELTLADFRDACHEPVSLGGWPYGFGSSHLKNNNHFQAVKRHVFSVVFDLPPHSAGPEPWQGSDVMHDKTGLFCAWPAPPDETEFNRTRSNYLAELACRDASVAKGIVRRANRLNDSMLKEALKLRTDADNCAKLSRALQTARDSGKGQVDTCSEDGVESR